jgi:acyl-coenzyme A synthetase/AMP-(fatty) acid ligase
MLLPPLENYQDFIKSYSRPELETFNYVDLIDGYAEDPDRQALVWCNEAGEERRLSFRDLSEQSAQLAHALTERGVKRGDRILIMFARTPEWAIASLASFRIGAVMISCVTMLLPKDIQYRIDVAEPAAFIVQGDQAHKFDELNVGTAVKIAHGEAKGWENWDYVCAGHPFEFQNVQLPWTAPASLYFTSGSTGLPKGVVHGAHFAHYLKEVSAYWLDLNAQSQDDLFWCTADTGWALAATGWLVGPWLAGTTMFIYDGPFDPQKRVDLLKQYGVTIFCAPATELRWIVSLPDENFDMPKLRLTVSTGEMLDPATAQRWMTKTDARLHEAFGQTESFMTIANMVGQDIRPGSMGLAVPGFDLQIIDQDNYTPCPAGTIGHIAIRQPTRAMMLEYWRDPDKTAEVFKESEGVRWYITGDLARRDEDGYFYYEGRADDIISSAGYRIGPGEVEAALIEHPAVKDCAAVGSPDVQRGEIVKAFIILNEGWLDRADDALVAELQSHVKTSTAPYKYPRLISFVDDLPRTATGKVRRKTLRDAEYEQTKQGVAA